MTWLKWSDLWSSHFSLYHSFHFRYCSLCAVLYHATKTRPSDVTLACLDLYLRSPHSGSDVMQVYMCWGGGVVNSVQSSSILLLASSLAPSYFPYISNIWLGNVLYLSPGIRIKTAIVSIFWIPSLRAALVYEYWLDERMNWMCCSFSAKCFILGGRIIETGLRNSPARRGLEHCQIRLKHHLTPPPPKKKE